MEKKNRGREKFCGNCGSHNVYHYPDYVLCWTRFCEGKDFIVKTLWHCEKWNPSSQECYCIEEAAKKQSSK